MKPKLSVILITYNHAKYVRKALDGILMQKTDFDYEIVVGDDCSADGTQDILREYSMKNPGKFRLLLREKNLGRPTLNVYLTSMEAEGEYLAYLEGDDYWNDDTKLQKQVDFLDTHPDYMGTTHSFCIIDENGDPSSDEQKEKLYSWSGDYTYENWERRGEWPGQTASNVCRNFYKNGKMDYSILYRAHDFIDDEVIFTFLLLQGKIYRFDDVMAAHRVIRKQGGGTWNSIKLKRDTMVEEFEYKCSLMKWIEKNAGLTDYEIGQALGRFKNAAGLWLKHPSARTWSMFSKCFGFYILHVKFGKVRKR